MTDTATIGLVDGVRPIVEIGVGNNKEPLGTAVWQPAAGTVTPSKWAPPGAAKTNNTWVGREPAWIDVSCYVQSVDTFVGRERAIDVWEIGTATVVVRNTGGWADSPPATNPLDPLLYVQPARPIRVGVAIDANLPVYLWAGYIDRADPGYDVEVGETVTFECIDAKGEAGRGFVGEVATAVGAGDFAHARVGRILNAIQWPTWTVGWGGRDLTASSVALRATTLGAKSVDLLDRAADSAGGGVFGTITGAIAFRPRDWQVFDPTTPIQGAISNFVGDPDAACPISWEMSWGREDISTRVLLGREGEVQITREDAMDRAEFGVETFERTDLETNLDADLGIIADRVLEVRSPDHMPRIAAVNLDAATGRNVVEVLTAANPYAPARFYCRHQGDDGRIVFNRTMMVVGVEHSLTPETWTARVALDDAKPFMVTSTARWSNGVDVTAHWQNPAVPDVVRSTWSRAA